MYNSLFNSKIVLISKLIKIDLVLIKFHYCVHVAIFFFFKIEIFLLGNAVSVHPSQYPNN